MNKEKPAHYQKVKKAFPEYIAMVEKLGETAGNAGPLDDKTAHLVQLAAAVTNKNEGAVHSHTRQLVALGAQTEEIHHAIILLTSTIGFPTVMAGISWANDILDTE